ncbi:MAG TPA: hypothetical protein VHL57_08430, partial [Flavobacteriales bacterium]|nr:hypothetical protein [Flavobacteriales bacterium]
MNKVFGIALLAVVTTGGCDTSPQQGFSYWAYRAHVIRYTEIASAVVRARATASPDQQHVLRLSDSLIGYVEYMEHALLVEAQQPDIREWKGEEPPPMERLLDHHTSTRLLIGDDPTHPNKWAYSASALEQELIGYKSNLVSISGF